MVEGGGGKKHVGAIHAMRAVLWSFFGVRDKSEYHADINRLTMPQIIVAGIVGAVLFVLTLLILVYFVTR
jgi:amino acid transporter